MTSSCVICGHSNRADIENALLAMTAGNSPRDTYAIDDIAAQYNVPVEDLKMHALFHTPLVGDAEIEELHANDGSNQTAAPRDSLTRKIKLREADMLAAVGQEYLVTLKAMGRRINRLAQVGSNDAEEEDKQFRIAKMLTKPMVDLYVGLGGEIRQTVKTMAEIDRMLNGPQDNLGGGLNALAAAIRGSDNQNG